MIMFQKNSINNLFPEHKSSVGFFLSLYPVNWHDCANMNVHMHAVPRHISAPRRIVARHEHVLGQ